MEFIVPLMDYKDYKDIELWIARMLVYKWDCEEKKEEFKHNLDLLYGVRPLKEQLHMYVLEQFRPGLVLNQDDNTLVYNDDASISVRVMRELLKGEWNHEEQKDVIKSNWNLAYGSRPLDEQIYMFLQTCVQSAHIIEFFKNAQKHSIVFQEGMTVDGIRKTMRELAVLLQDSMQCSFPDEMLEEAIKYAVLSYLIAWMKGDKNCRQNIEAFIQYGYYSEADVKELKIKKQEETVPREKVTSMRNAEQKYRKMLALKNMQAKEEGTKCYRGSYKVNHKRCHNFLELCLFEQNVNNTTSLWPLINLLFFRKEFFQITHNNKNYNGDLIDAYECLENLLAHIVTLREEDSTAREFVVSCFQFLSFESSTKCTWYARMAKYLTIKEMDVPTELPLPLKLSLFRFPVSFGPKHRTIVNSICLYTSDAIFDCFFSEETKSTNSYEDRIAIVRMIAFYIVSCCKVIKPVSRLPHWTEETFQDAKKFLINECNILAHFQPLRFSECNKCDKDNANNKNIDNEEVYIKLRKIYKESDAVEKRWIQLSRTIKQQ